jgi:hypothetical protein
MTHEDIANLGGLAFGGNKQPNDVQAGASVEQDPPSPCSLAPLDEHACLVPRFVRRSTGSEQANTHP